MSAKLGECGNLHSTDGSANNPSYVATPKQEF
jgi:hypothetical protein